MDRLLLERVTQVVSKRQQELKEDKDRVNKVVAKVIALGKIGRREGLLALEEASENILKNNSFENSLLKQLIEYIIDGTDPAVIEKIMTTKFLFNEYDVVESLIFYIITNGCMMIQDGENTAYIKESLKACIPIAFIDEDFDRKIDKLVNEQINKIINE